MKKDTKTHFLLNQFKLQEVDEPEVPTDKM